MLIWSEATCVLAARVPAGLGPGLTLFDVLVRLQGWGLSSLDQDASELHGHVSAVGCTCTWSNPSPVGWLHVLYLQGWGLASLDQDASDLQLLAQHLVQAHDSRAWVLMGHSTGCQDAVRCVLLLQTPNNMRPHPWFPPRGALCGSLLIGTIWRVDS